MTPVSCLEDLNKLRASARRKLAERAKKIEVKVHLGSCGIASGAKDVQEAFLKEVNDMNSLLEELGPIKPATESIRQS